LHRQYQDGDSAWKLHFMLKKWMFYIGIALIVGFVSSAFKPLPSNKNQWFYNNKEEANRYVFPSKNTKEYLNLQIPSTGKFFIGFKEAIGFKESQCKYHMVNSLGYIGKYQFGASTLATIGIKDSVQFMNSPKLQEKAFVALLSRNKWELQDEIVKYEGKVIDGVKITESGLLAAAHLGGAGSVKKFLHTNGRKKCKDAFGSSIKSYVKEFGGYKINTIVADKNARVN
jgi:hypothetical protein